MPRKSVPGAIALAQNNPVTSEIIPVECVTGIGPDLLINSANPAAHGLRHLIRTMPDWFGVCLYKEVRRGDPELMRQAAE